MITEIKHSTNDVRDWLRISLKKQKKRQKKKKRRSNGVNIHIQSPEEEKIKEEHI